MLYSDSSEHCPSGWRVSHRVHRCPVPSGEDVETAQNEENVDGSSDGVDETVNSICLSGCNLSK